jgi:hypothetical protein
MATSDLVVHLEVRRRWWLVYYLSGVTWCATTFHMEPNWSRVLCWVMRGIKVVVRDGNGRRIA